VSRRRVTLTFDNGPTAGVTEDVLRTLRDRELPATFFVVGRDLLRDGARELAQSAAADGHWIGNHTMTHSVQLGDAEDNVARREIADAQDVLGDLAHPDRLFRPYGGGGVLSRRLLSRAALDELESGGYTCVLWNSVSRDWDDPDGWVARCVEDVTSREWSVVVLHDTPTGAMAHLPRFLDALAEDDVEIVQEFPADCMPVRRGVVRRVDDLLSLTNERSP
jgi:peptidoglycan/xylan/chitin deacetylase (PgdA/CDA1 family)